jgi:hypothetical protein
MFVYLISIFYTVQGEKKLNVRWIKLFFIAVGFLGVATLCYCDA